MKIIPINDQQQINSRKNNFDFLNKLKLFLLFLSRSFQQVDPLQIHLPSIVMPTPPSSPHLEFLRQQYAYLHANSTNTQNLFVPTNYDCLMAQKVLAQQFLDNYRTSIEQQYQNQQCGYTLVEGI